MHQVRGLQQQLMMFTLINNNSYTLTQMWVRFFDAIQADCIPVIIADHFLLPYEDVIEYSLFVLDVAEKDVLEERVDVVSFVKDVTKHDETKMRKRMQENKHHFIYNNPFIFPGDATDLLLRELAVRADVLKSHRHFYLRDVEKKMLKLKGEGNVSVVGDVKVKRVKLN